MTQADYLACRSLQDLAIKPSTRRRYADDVISFVSWAQQRGIVLDVASDVDSALAEYFNYKYVVGGGVGKGAASNCFNGILYFVPELQNQRVALPAAAQALRGWRKAKPVQSYPPITWEVAVSIAVQMARHGEVGMAVGVLLAWDAMLRLGELVALRTSDVMLSGESDRRVPAEYRGAGLRIRLAKTGREQWAPLHNGQMADMLRWYLATRPAADRLFSFSAEQFRAKFKLVCAEFALPPEFVPHSCRHGGATCLFLMGWPLDTIMIDGRWAERKSARRYIQAGRALLLALDIPDNVAMAGRIMSSDIKRAVAEAREWVRDW